MRIGDQRFILDGPFKRTVLQFSEHLQECLCAQISKPIGKFRGRKISTRKLLFVTIRTRIKTSFHLHDTHPNLSIVCKDGAFDRRCPTPTRQERPVHVQTTVRRQVDDLFGQEHTVGSNADDIGSQAFKLVEGIVVFERGVFEHRDLMRKRRLLHGAWFELLSARTDRIGLREHTHHIIGLHQLIEDGRSKCRSSHENDSHTHAFLLLTIQLRRALRHAQEHLGILAALEPYRSGCMLRRASFHPSDRSRAAGNDQASHRPL